MIFVNALLLHASLCVFSLLWPSPRTSPKLWVQGSCPARWLLQQRWRPQRPRTRWPCVRLLPRRTRTTSCKARLSATPSWDLLLGRSALPTGRSSSLLTDASSHDSSQSGSIHSKKHTVKLQISEEQLMSGGGEIQSFQHRTARIAKERSGGMEHYLLFPLYLRLSIHSTFSTKRLDGSVDGIREEKFIMHWTLVHFSSLPVPPLHFGHNVATSVHRKKKKNTCRSL